MGFGHGELCYVSSNPISLLFVGRAPLDGRVRFSVTIYRTYIKILGNDAATNVSFVYHRAEHCAECRERFYTTVNKLLLCLRSVTGERDKHEKRIIYRNVIVTATYWRCM